jgi:hypothetical protein
MNNRRSVSLGDINNYKNEELKKVLFKIQESVEEKDVLLSYLDYIRNYNNLTNEMLENIKKMDDNSKMIIIKEINNLIMVINDLANM